MVENAVSIALIWEGYIIALPGVAGRSSGTLISRGMICGVKVAVNLPTWRNYEASCNRRVLKYSIALAGCGKMLWCSSSAVLLKGCAQIRKPHPPNETCTIILVDEPRPASYIFVFTAYSPLPS